MIARWQRDLAFTAPEAEGWRWSLIAEELDGHLTELVAALRDARKWIARPSDIPAQHAETLIRVTHEIDDVLAEWEEQA